MIATDDIDIIENGTDSMDEYYAAIQSAINSLSAWSLQGAYGRAMMQAIEDGYCLLGRGHTRDYWGNRIPSREEVRAGTKGSYDYVAQRQGQDWANFVREI